jgi:hypothetical protein
MNIYVTDKNPRLCADWVTDYNWAGRAMDAMELIAAGLEHWQGEESEIVCSEPEHSLVKWVQKNRKNWQWVICYGYWLLRELNRRDKDVPEGYLAFIDYVVHEYGADQLIWGSTPPICLPKEYKRGKECRDVVRAYRMYVRDNKKMHSMGKREPFWMMDGLAFL